MNRFFLMKNPEIFQGKQYLKKNKNYFEGWYFKNTNGKDTISFIPGISINSKEKKAFIQVITNNESYNIDYNINEFRYNNNPFFVEIGNNYFSKEKIHIDINDKKQNLKIKGILKLSEIKNIKINYINPNIMGPFSYIPDMECNHAILSMNNKIYGSIKINNKKLKFKDGIGYIEKDWGISFPKNYIWMQGNNFKNKNASFMLSIATIPFKGFIFKGLICDLIIEDKEYRFATYNNAKIIKCEKNKEELNIRLKKGKYILDINTKYTEGNTLSAPIKGKMERDIIESISSKITVTLKKKDKIIFSDTSTNCGLEIVE